MFGRLQIQHELGKRPVQAGHVATHEAETGAGQFGGRLEVQSERGSDIDMVLDFKIEFTRRSDAAYLDIGRFVLPYRNGLMRNIGNGKHEFREFRLQFGESDFICLELVANATDFGHDSGSIFFFAF